MKFMMIALLMIVDVALAGDTVTLKIQISGADNRNGVVSIALFNSENTFLKEPYRSIEVPISEDNYAVATFEKLPFGEYAASAIHDENKNGKMDTGFMRRPKESYAFSNNAKARLGPAKYKDARFQVSAGDVYITMALN